MEQLAARTASRLVLVVDDDQKIVQLVRAYLEREGFAVKTAGDGRTALALISESAPDLIVLDLMLPELDGMSVARRVREDSDVPILMLSARGAVADRIQGIAEGADDYLPKPFQPRELLARLRAILRRGKSRGRAAPLRFGSLEIDRDSRSVRVDGQERSLTGYQFALLVALAENAGRVLSRETLMDLVKGEPLEAFDRSIDVHVSRIRAAIEDDPKKPRRIVTVRGAGYVFAKAQE